MENEEEFGLQSLVDAGWSAIRQRPFWGHVGRHGWDRDLYGIVMTQIYHYTRHNSINQAVAAVKADPDNTELLRFVYDHARDELGHEKMAAHDLKSIGLLRPGMLQAPPLPATRALIGYLHYVALELGAVPRLGYSYWAESSYHQFADLLQRGREDLNLSDANMTFFVAHSRIDQKHAEEVEKAIMNHAVTDVQRQQVREVAETTLYLTGVMLDNCLEAYLAGRRGKSD